MANQEQLEILKQGVQAWNKWQTENLTTEIDLRDAELSRANLSRADLRAAKLMEVNLSQANLSGANLWGANLKRANLRAADLKEAKLSRANLTGAKFIEADLREADLSRAKLRGANLREADLRGADLGGADLREADFTGADLSDANFSIAQLYATTFANTDLGKTKGLESIMHGGASTIGTDVLSLSMGKIPELFLRGCGLSDWEIEFAKLYQPNITNHDMDDILYKVHEIRAHQPLQISRLFISHSHADSKFVDRVEKSLIKRGIRFWRDIHHSTSGPLEEQIDRAISQNPTMLVVFSENSIKSDWVQHEVRKAREIEKDIGRPVLCPIALDDSWNSSRWPKRIIEQVMEYNILDFSTWEDDEKFEKMFIRLIDGLNLYYKKEDSK